MRADRHAGPLVIIGGAEDKTGESEILRRFVELAGGQLISKVGAEGVYTAGVLPSASYPEGLGLAFKIEDGDKADRARSPVAIEPLQQLGALDDAQAAEIKGSIPNCRISNHRGDEVGSVETCFKLELLRAP